MNPVHIGPTLSLQGPLEAWEFSHKKYASDIKIKRISFFPRLPLATYYILPSFHPTFSLSQRDCGMKRYDQAIPTAVRNRCDATVADTHCPQDRLASIKFWPCGGFRNKVLSDNKPYPLPKKEQLGRVNPPHLSQGVGAPVRGVESSYVTTVDTGRFLQALCYE
jgi:hypothetical protein